MAISCKGQSVARALGSVVVCALLDEGEELPVEGEHDALLAQLARGCANVQIEVDRRPRPTFGWGLTRGGWCPLYIYIYIWVCVYTAS